MLVSLFTIVHTMEFMQRKLLSSYEVELETDNYINADTPMQDEQVKRATT